MARATVSSTRLANPQTGSLSIVSLLLQMERNAYASQLGRERNPKSVVSTHELVFFCAAVHANELTPLRMGSW